MRVDRGPRPGRQHDGWILVGMEERLSRPRFGACGGVGKSVRCLRRYRRVLMPGVLDIEQALLLLELDGALAGWAWTRRRVTPAPAA